MSLYRTVLADPPWPVGSSSRTRPWVMGVGGRRRRASAMPYELMELDDIWTLPVAELVEQDAHLYLWITAKLNAQGVGIQTLDSWGFRWVGEIVWAKPNYGLGAFPRPQHEVLIVARRGSLSFARRDVGSVQTWRQARLPNNGGKIHSAKPDGAQDLIESASPGPYLEMFARRQRLGWDTWGNEALEHVSIAAPAAVRGNDE